jgi:hypothetical protein
MIDYYGPCITYGDDDPITFIRRCEKCGRYVKANEKINVNESTGLKDEPNAICSRCGPTKMICLGYI